MISFKRKVISGNQKGGEWGIPTVNFSPHRLNLPYGIYICDVLHNNQYFWGVLHFGPLKTFDNKLTLEVHIFDFDKIVYGEILEVRIYDKLREIEKFEHEEHLINEIKKDIQLAKKYIKTHYHKN